MDDLLSEAKETTSKKGVTRNYEKAGTVVSLRPGSNTGGTAVEIRISSKKIIKIRY
ncbi:hypothetical protein HB935_07790 [Listeria welshimeri]|nr:hypothetical protein [Listeria welshimeri]